MKLSRLTFVAAVVAAVLLFVSGSGTRFGLWAFPVGFRVLKWAAYLGLAAAVVSLVGLVVPKLRAGQGGRLVVSLALGLGVATWIFSPLKFQADMGLLLCFLFLMNMVGALVLLPALARGLLGDTHQGRG
jgi:hypothetical protein